VITLESWLRPLVLSATRRADPGGFPHWGDVSTWATAGVAFLALIAAAFAYSKQAEAVGQQGTLLDLQRKQLADQQAANRKQAEAMDAQMREMQQRAESFERQQADAITLTPGGGGTAHCRVSAAVLSRTRPRTRPSWATVASDRSGTSCAGSN
jgi:hypothetical protein